MISKEQLATVTEVLATASVVGVGWALGGPTGATLMAGIGINLGSDIIQKGSTHLKEKWISVKYGVLNHDIQRALARAFVKALASLEARYFELPEANAHPTEKKEAIRGLFKELKDEAPAVFAASLEEIVSGQEVKEYLYGEPEAARAKLWERVEGTRLLYTYYGEHFKEFLRDNINDELVFWFGEELKTDNRECNKAWRAFQRMLLEGIQADVKAVHASQEMIRQDLQVLDGIRTQLDELKDTIDRRLAGEPFQQGLEQALHSMKELLEKVAGTTQRTEIKVDLVVGVTRRTEEKLDTVVAALSAKPEAKMKKPSEAHTRRFPVSLNLDVPPSIRGFVGRSMELSELESHLEQHSAINVEGLSGIGKTSLVLSLADRWLRSGRLGPNDLFYFDCSQRNMRLGVASEFLLRNLAVFFSQVGDSEVANTVANEQQPLDHRHNAVSSTLMRGRFLLFLDNLQDALDENRRIASQPLADLLYFVLSRPLAESRFICASYVQCSWSSRLPIQPYRLKALSTKDARELLLSLGLEDFGLANRAAQLVGRHPQAIRWFSVLPRELGLSVEEVINDLSDDIDYDATGVEFQRRIEGELLKRIWDTLPDGVGHFLSLCTVFRRPVPFSALCALTPTPEVDRWRQILLDRFLLDASTRDGPHSLHDIVRKFAAQRIQSGTGKWQDAHRAAANWWETIAITAVHGTREELEAQIEAHYHLVSAGDTDKAHALAMRLRPILRTAGRQSYRQGLREENEVVHRASVQMAPDDPRAHLYLASTLSRQGNSEAEIHFRRALELDPQFSLARTKYAQFLAAHHRNEEAEEQLRQGIRSDPQNGGNHVRYASFLARSNRFDDAEAQFRVGLELEPEAAELRNVYALFLAQRELHGEAEKQFHLALKTQAKNALVLESYAKFLIDRDRFDEAERHLSEAIEIDPNSIHQLTAYLKLPSKHRRIEVVGTVLKALTKIGSRNPSLRRQYLEVFSGHAAPEQVDFEFKAALSVEERGRYIRNLYIKYLIGKGRIDDAEQQYEADISARPKYALGRNSYAAFLSKRGRPKEAEEQFDAAIAAEPDNIWSYKPYVEFLARRRRFDEANEQLRKIRQLNPGHAVIAQLASFVERQELVLRAPSGQEDTQELMAVLRENMTNLELPAADRIIFCKAMLRADPDDFQAHYCLGRTLLEQLKDAPSAEPFLLRATELRPSAPTAHLYYGQALEKQGKFDAAFAALSKIQKVGPKNAELYNSKANCLKQLGRFSEAEAEYRNAILTSKKPFTPKYLNNLALLFAAWPDTSRILEGIQLCQQLARDYPNFRWTAMTLSQVEGRKDKPASDC